MKFFAAGRDVDMTSAPFMKKLTVFTLPLVVSGILQLLYNSADLIVVGQLSRDASNAQAAISSTTSLVHLLVNLFIGLSVGINVTCANSLGARNHDETFRVVHTSFFLAVVSGLFVAVIGTVFSDDLLRLMQSPEDVLPLSTLYLRIYFIGSPFNIWYNFGAAILRSKGDTQKPLVYLAISGTVNVVLNIFFVLVLDMSVDGVAIATVTSQVLSAVLVTISLIKEDGPCKLDISKLSVNGKTLGEIVRIGLPAGIQSSLFSISNVIIQSSINSLGGVVIAGNGNAQSVEGFVCITVEAIGQAAVAFIAQNCGAKKKENVRIVMKDSFILMTIASLILSAVVVLLRRPLLYIFSPDENAADYGEMRLIINVSIYFTYGWMQIIVSFLRGLGKGVLPMTISLIGICLFRVLWIYTVFKAVGTYESVIISYPISWIITGAAQLAAYFITRKKTFGKLFDEAHPPAAEVAS